MKSDPKDFPQMMAEKKAVLTVKHLSKENRKMKLLAFYEVYFAVERVRETNATVGSTNPQTKPRKPNRQRTFE